MHKIKQGISLPTCKELHAGFKAVFNQCKEQRSSGVCDQRELRGGKDGYFGVNMAAEQER